MLNKIKFIQKYGYLLGFGALLLIFALSLNSYAQTNVTPSSDSCTYNVTTKIAFAFLDEGSQARSQKLVDRWQSGIKSNWPGSESNYPFGECKCKIQFDFEIDALPPGNNCNNALDGYHCINVIHKPTNSRGHIADTNEWVTSATANDAAMVLGQIMGLDFDYHFQDKNNDGEADSFVNNSKSDDSHILAFIAKNNATCSATCCDQVDKPEPEKTTAQPIPIPIPTPIPQTQPDPIPTPDPTPTPSATCNSHADCNDNNPNTDDSCANPGTSQARCDNFTITTCKGGDNYCPSNCNSKTDSDCQSACGNQVCESGESCTTCPNDCGTCGPVCGDRKCDQNESCQSCPNDCGLCSTCGDGICSANHGEDARTCPADCQVATPPSSPTANFNFVP